MVNKSPKNLLCDKTPSEFPKARARVVKLVPEKKPVKTNGNEPK